METTRAPTGAWALATTTMPETCGKRPAPICDKPFSRAARTCAPVTVVSTVFDPKGSSVRMSRRVRRWPAAYWRLPRMLPPLMMAICAPVCARMASATKSPMAASPPRTTRLALSRGAPSVATSKSSSWLRSFSYSRTRSAMAGSGVTSFVSKMRKFGHQEALRAPSSTLMVTSTSTATT